MKKILVLCANSWDKAGLRAGLFPGHELIFSGEELLEDPKLVDVLRFDVLRYIEKTAAQFSGVKLDGVIGTGDYPGCMLAAGVAEKLGLLAPRLKDVIVLSHKLYSREIQRAHVPEATPDFIPLDPFARKHVLNGLSYPLFVKPVKGTMSIRARMVRDEIELREAMNFTWRERIAKYLLLRPFQQLLRSQGDGRVPAHYFIGEAPLSGVQVTVDGFVQNRRVTIMGIVDSVMYPGTISFQRFDLPSRLPAEVCARMEAIAAKVIEGSGFDHSCFNIEMFYDETSDRISIIEINPRMSYQFADLYQKVDGTSTYAVQLALATGVPVNFKKQAGADGAAASFVLRRFQDGIPVQLPSAAEIARAEARFPGASVRVLCKLGERLSAQDQDVGSFRYGIINMGAKTFDALLADYEEMKKMLPFYFHPVV